MAADPGIHYTYPDPVAMAGEAANIYYNQPAAEDLVTAVAGSHAGGL